MDMQLCRAAQADKIPAFKCETIITRNKNTELTTICGH